MQYLSPTMRGIFFETGRKLTIRILLSISAAYNLFTVQVQQYLIGTGDGDL